MSLADGVAEVYRGTRSVCEPLGLRIGQLVVSLGMAAPGSDGEHPGDLEHQARAVFRAMKEFVERSGGGLENIAKATAYVRTEQEREPVNGLWWEELFPDPADKPAYKVLVAPLPAGRAIELDVLAVLGATRRRIDVPGVPARDPTVEIGGLVFTSRVHGTVPFTGDQVAAGGVYGQARQAFENVLTLVSLAGGTAADIAALTSFCRTSGHANPTREALAEIFPDEETWPPLNTVTNFIPAKFDVMVEMAAEVGGKVSGPAEYREIPVPEGGSARVRAVRIGQVVYASRLLPSTAPGTDLKTQLESVLERVALVIREAGGGTRDIARVTLFMREVKDRRVLNEVWTKWFPDPACRPPHKYVPAEVPVGYEVMADAVAVLNGERRVLTVAGLEHGDPMSIGARTGNLVFSSRLFAAEEDAESQLARLLEHARVLMADAGGELRDLTQVTVFVSSPDAVTSVERSWRCLWADAKTGTEPDLHVVVADLGGGRKPRMEIIGVLPAGA